MTAIIDDRVAELERAVQVARVPGAELVQPLQIEMAGVPRRRRLSKRPGSIRLFDVDAND